MKVKIPKSHQATKHQNSLIIGGFSYSLVNETKQHYVLDNCSMSGIETLAFIFGGDSIVITKGRKNYSYNDVQWRD